MAIDPKLKLKLAITGAPVINGFSYPFLNLLVLRARKIESGDALYGNKPEWYLDTEAAAIINHISDQLKIESPVSQSNRADPKEVERILGSAEEFLAIFEATDEEIASLGSRRPQNDDPS
jgi:hypothetical protein